MANTKPTTFHPLISRRTLEQLVRSTSLRLVERTGKEFTLIVILKAAWIFAADLMRQLPPTVEVEFVSVSTYLNSQEPQKIPVVTPLFDPISLANKRVVILDTIYDTGATLKAVKNLVAQAGPSTLTTCTLMAKRHIDAIDGPDLVGKELGDAFVVGFGMDFKQQFRGQRYISIVETAQGEE